MTCNNPNPWDARIRCNRPAGHPALHEWRDEPALLRWSDACHFDGDDCGDPCANRWAS